ncbi:putative membrane protein [Pasteurella testudinis DSM 23072]|uniref:UPF0283 membrane protein SAMN05660772_02364 n=1 Tax=Pasteurella testudinis DSM 23072 TaxID=1122938 RepID=A0A1W1UV37_9PAST|nr:TIGR01620 family protein [Pasteurella testudinis]SMB84839.1 putative membrane protein [Pasteurella testudinis DSM 23072]SUB51250.1 membrane protein [Pasteurella testudinis]
MNKKYFDTVQDKPHFDNEQQALQQKKEFEGVEVSVDPESEALNRLDQRFDQTVEQMVEPQPRWWKMILAATGGLFLIAVVAQSVQWVLDSWQQNQWIQLAFAIATFSVVILGIVAIAREFKRLFKLKRLMRLQRQSHDIQQGAELRQRAVTHVLDQADGEQGRQLCLQIADNMNLDKDDPRLQLWQKQLNEVHSANEVSYLFSQNVLSEIDRKARRLVSKSAAEAAIVVGVSPLAVVDLFFVAWRNLALINKIAALYGIELGYFSRIRLLRMVLLNMAFAGATELVHDIGMDWLSKDLMAKLSARAAQGLGVGLLTARLGIKTMEFCRPLAFLPEEKPRLGIIHQELLTTLKSTLSSTLFSSEKEKV